MKTGLTHSADCIVNEANTAAAVASGALPVFATPAMIALMEKAAFDLMEAHMEPGQTTVGIGLEITHERASALGAKIRATATILHIDGRALTFTVEASDEKGLIGRGTHKRFIVDAERFLAKL